MVGKTGVGKSALINEICGDDVAMESLYSRCGETTEVTKYEKRVGNFTVYIYDTPGLNNVDPSLKDWSCEVDLNLFDERNGYLQLTEEEYERAKEKDPTIRKHAHQLLEYGEAR